MLPNLLAEGEYSLKMPFMEQPKPPQAKPATPAGKPQTASVPLPEEVGGAQGPDPTRYGDWQHKGRVSDF